MTSIQIYKYAVSNKNLREIWIIFQFDVMVQLHKYGIVSLNISLKKGITWLQ